MTKEYDVREPYNARKLHLAEADDPLGKSLCGSWMGGSTICTIEEGSNLEDAPLHRHDPDICKTCLKKTDLRGEVE